jgi:hypothetical protein
MVGMTLKQTDYHRHSQNKDSVLDAGSMSTCCCTHAGEEPSTMQDFKTDTFYSREEN